MLDQRSNIFVENAKAGDKNVKIKINSVSSRFATAEGVADAEVVADPT
jgi:predicted RNA-binding protein with TRAM domain